MGGALLLGLAVMVCVSVLGRAAIPLGLRPVPGDVELVEMGVAIAVMAMLPYGHLVGANARVDVLRPLMGDRLAAALDALSNLAVLVVALVLCWTLGTGLADKLAYRDTTFILRLPLWIGYGGALAGAALFVLVAALRLVRPLEDRP